MSAGTISLTNNSNSISGSGTFFKTDLKNNDFIIVTVGGVTYTLGIESIASDTSLTLVKKFDGPTTSGLAWTALPAAAMVLMSAQTAADVAKFVRAANYDKINWQQVYSELGDITITLLDGSQFSGPSWRKIANLLADLDIDNITMIADQIHADADQVAADKPVILQAKDDAVAANTAAQAAKSDAQAANDSAQQAKSDAATQADIAESEADRAKAEADRAAASNPDNALIKANNLSDLADKPQARMNLDVYSKGEVDAKGGGWIGKVDICALRSAIPGGRVAGDGQTANRAGTYAGIWAEITAGRLPVIDDADWLADPKKRGFYSRGDGSTTFRFPDYNGVQTGSFPAPVWRGDGGLTDGNMQQNAAPNITGQIGIDNGYGLLKPTAPREGAFIQGGATTSSAAGTANAAGRNLGIDASQANATYGRDGATEVRMNAMIGCWVIQYAGVANNAGSIDALALANRIEDVNAAVSAVNGRIDHAVITTSSNVSLNQRLVLENPFGINTPVDCYAEVFANGKWANTGYIYVSPGGYGVAAQYVEGEGIIVQTGDVALVTSGKNGGGGHGTLANVTTPAACRVQIFKVR